MNNNPKNNNYGGGLPPPNDMADFFVDPNFDGTTVDDDFVDHTEEDLTNNWYPAKRGTYRYIYVHQINALFGCTIFG